MIVINRAVESDAKTLADLGRSTFIETFAKDNRDADIQSYVNDTFGINQQRTEILDPNRIIEIAKAKGVAIGFLHLKIGKPHPSVKGSNPIEILRIYVDSKWHGKHVGAALMDKAIEIGRLGGFKTLWLGVWEKNLRAQSFYHKYGFKKTGSHLFRLGSDNQNDYIMELAI